MLCDICLISLVCVVHDVFCVCIVVFDQICTTCIQYVIFDIICVYSSMIRSLLSLRSLLVHVLCSL